MVASPGSDTSGEFPCALGPAECTSLSDALITHRAPDTSPGVCIYTDKECGCSAKTENDDDTCIHVDSRISDITGICSMGECRKSRFVCDCLAPTHVCKRRPCMRWEPREGKSLESFECNRVNSECVIKEDDSPRMATPISPRTSTVPPPTTSTLRTTETTPRPSTTTTTTTNNRPPTTVPRPTTTQTTTPIPTTTSTTTTKQWSTFKFLSQLMLPNPFLDQAKSDFYGEFSFLPP